MDIPIKFIKILLRAPSQISYFKKLNSALIFQDYNTKVQDVNIKTLMTYYMYLIPIENGRMLPTGRVELVT